jgi:hypothetical protein
MSTEWSAHEAARDCVSISSFTTLYLIQYTCIGLNETSSA